jgi:hypothetical protein
MKNRNVQFVHEDFEFFSNAVMLSTVVLNRLLEELAGLPALQCGESGQVRKEAATATYCKCRGKARLLFQLRSSHE